MNPASRLSAWAAHLHRQKDTTKMMDAYKSFIGDDSDYAVWRTMCALQQEAMKIRTYTDSLHDNSRYQELHDALTALLYPNGIRTVQIAQVRKSIETARLMLNVLRDTLDGTYLYENDVSDRIDALKDALETFITSLNGLPDDPYVARMYVRVSIKMKEALEMYRITGVDGMREALAAFDCVFDDSIKGKSSLIDKAQSIVTAAKAARDVTSVATDIAKLLGF